MDLTSIIDDEKSTLENDSHTDDEKITFRSGQVSESSCLTGKNLDNERITFARKRKTYLTDWREKRIRCQKTKKLPKDDE